MTATNIDIEQFMNVLASIHANGVRLINLDMLPDEGNPSMNKLIIHPIRSSENMDVSNGNLSNPNRIAVRNPKIDPNNDDIFNSLNNI